MDGPIHPPPVPRFLPRLLDLLGSPRADGDDAARLLSGDPALTLEILRVVNSAYYGLPRPVGELRYALAYLGVAEVVRIAVALTTVNALRPQGPEGEAQVEGFCRHAFMTTLAARQVLRLLPGVDRIDELFAAALLHNAGRLVYLGSDPELYVESAVLAVEQGILIGEAEQRMGVRSHKELGGELATRWKLPRAVVRAASFHDLDDLRSLPGARKAPAYDVAICIGSLLVETLLRPLADEVVDAIAKETQRTLGIDGGAFVYLLGEGEEWKLRADQLVPGAP